MIDDALELEVSGHELLAEPLDNTRIESLCQIAAGSAAVTSGHLAVNFVDAERIHQLNLQYRGIDRPTDVLSFPVDGTDELEGQPRELGDVIICPEHTEDIEEAVVHGVLHLVGMDHETDSGQMLALQAEILSWDLAVA